jgi:hypothetical protein
MRLLLRDEIRRKNVEVCRRFLSRTMISNGPWFTGQPAGQLVYLKRKHQRLPDYTHLQSSATAFGCTTCTYPFLLMKLARINPASVADIAKATKDLL